MSTRNLIFLTAVALVATGAVVATLRSRPESPTFSLSPSEPRDPRAVRRVLFDLLEPVTLTNCTLERFGEPNDGGYLMCGNLLGGAKSGYSYGISGYDKWGCDVSTKLNVGVHQYDCFNLKRPVCAGRDGVSRRMRRRHAQADEDGRVFDTIERQLMQNGDEGPPCRDEDGRRGRGVGFVPADAG